MAGRTLGSRGFPVGRMWTVRSTMWVKTPLGLVGLGKEDFQVVADSGTQVGSWHVRVCVCVCVCVGEVLSMTKEKEGTRLQGATLALAD